MADIGDRVTIHIPGKKSAVVYMERWPGGVAVSHGYGWFVLDPAEWEKFKAEGDRLMAGGGEATAEKPPQEAPGVPGPRSVTYDMSVTDGYSVLTAALEEFSADQRDRARNEGGNPRRHEWADLADVMRGQAEDARNAPVGAQGGAPC